MSPAAEFNATRIGKYVDLLKTTAHEDTHDDDDFVVALAITAFELARDMGNAAPMADFFRTLAGRLDNHVPIHVEQLPEAQLDAALDAAEAGTGPVPVLLSIYQGVADTLDPRKVYRGERMTSYGEYLPALETAIRAYRVEGFTQGQCVRIEMIVSPDDDGAHSLTFYGADDARLVRIVLCRDHGYHVMPEVDEPVDGGNVPGVH